MDLEKPLKMKNPNKVERTSNEKNFEEVENNFYSLVGDNIMI